MSEIFKHFTNPEVIAGGLLGIVLTLLFFYLLPYVWRWIYSKFIVSSILKGKWTHYYATYDKDGEIVLYCLCIHITPSLRNSFDVQSYNDAKILTAKGAIHKDVNGAYMMTIKATHHSDVSYILFHEPRWNNGDTYFLGFTLSHDANQMMTSSISIFAKEPFKNPNERVREILGHQIIIDKENKILKNSPKKG